MSPSETERQNALYDEAIAAFGPALRRLARCYESDPDKRGDLLQDVHIAIWRSFLGFEQKCSLRTWVYRVAHNVAASEMLRRRRDRGRQLVSLEEVEDTLTSGPSHASAERVHALDRVYALIHRLRPLDRQIILLYLEGTDAASIAEVTGLSASSASTRVHRIKHILAKRFQEGPVA